MNDPEPEAKFQEWVNESEAALKALMLAETFIQGARQAQSPSRLVRFKESWTGGAAVGIKSSHP